MERIPVCTRYRIDGVETEDFPYPAALPAAEPVYEYLPGWGCDIGGARSFSALPKAAQDYVTFVEERIGAPVRYVSVGADRDAIILR